MTTSLDILCATAAVVAFVHTLLGPDHYVPFVAMSRAGRWSVSKTLVVTLLCGIGHVASSVVLGFAGIAFGIGVLRLEGIESARGSLAGWALLAFGLAYFLWGVRRAIRNKPHSHWHGHGDGTVHVHEHVHRGEHTHVHDLAADDARSMNSDGARRDGPPPSRKPARGTTLTPWVLFTIFVFGPCEPLIPILMYPAAQGSIWSVVLVTTVFAVVTIGTMTVLVLAGCIGVGRLHMPFFERYSHALAGLTLVACGAAIKLGL